MIKMKNVFTVVLVALIVSACSPQAASQANAAEHQPSTISEPSVTQTTNPVTEINQYDIIQKKQTEFIQQKLNAVYLPQLANLDETQSSRYHVDLIIKNGIYHLIVLDLSNVFNKTYFLINLENDQVLEQGNQAQYDAIRKDAIEVSGLTHQQEAIFIIPDKFLPYCDNPHSCKYITNYDIDYHMGLGGTKSAHHLVMQNTTYQPDKTNQPLRIGYFGFSNSPKLPEPSSLQSIIVHQPTKISFFNGKAKPSLTTKIVPADIVSSITKMWKLDDKSRYLVWFGDHHPFLFMILDIERGLDIPENHLAHIDFVSYPEMLKNLGHFKDPEVRAKQ